MNASKKASVTDYLEKVVIELRCAVCGHNYVATSLCRPDEHPPPGNRPCYRCGGDAVRTGPETYFGGRWNGRVYDGSK